jgi:hypothetical protein
VANKSAWRSASYPTLSLSDARRKADERRRSVRDGVDIVAKRKADKRAAAVTRLSTFGAVADEWLEKRKPLCSGGSHEKLTWMVGSFGLAMVCSCNRDTRSIALDFAGPSRQSSRCRDMSEVGARPVVSG